LAVPVGSIAIVVAIVREPESAYDASDGFIHVGGGGGDGRGENPIPISSVV
jgi:hypothetical protein